jgi:hypothetical protein
MERKFERIAKLLGSGLSRRQALGRLGASLGASVVGVLGIGSRASAATVAECNTYCRQFTAASAFLACRSTCLRCPSTSQLCGTTGQSTTCCNSGSSCVNGTCVAADLCAGVVCNPPDACHSAVCDPGTGRCIFPPRPNGTACNDGNVCTQSDSCQAGVCVGVPRVCDDGNPCTDDVCDPAAGCIHRPKPDGTACGGGMVCQAGVCGQCVNGATRSCYTGPAGTAGVGVCSAGTQTCTSGVWGPCAGQVLPSAETCDGLDNDCDGTYDEGSLCPPGMVCVDATCVGVGT